VATFVAAIYADVGLSALAFVLLLIVAFTYMARLVAEARERTRQYASLSWGVLSGLIRTLDERDSRAARHCAAVAAFSRDIAKHAGFSERDQELAHTAGLLHDIGKFALSDRVMERGTHLEESDWRGIRRHPEIGADLLKDIGVYGPVADIIRAHHERLDGRGYPRGLVGDEIPPIARILAVAEVYDTLTAPDTYRTPMNSFEALTELRRVAGSQLEPRYVDALGELLAGRGTDYRHADEADFDRELDMERRITEATTVGPA
jgi:putative nucleotidyltransferase with HDIG domain